MEAMEKYHQDESIAKPVVPAALTSARDGIEVLSIDEVESQKVGEAYDRAVRTMIEFREIEGFSYEIKVWSKVDEALEMMGLGG